MYLKEIGCQGVERIKMAQNLVYWLFRVQTALKLTVCIKCEENSDQLSHCKLLKTNRFYEFAVIFIKN